MTSWRNKTSLLFLFVLLTIFHPSKGGCPHYFKSKNMELYLNKSIQLIESEDPTIKWVCTLRKNRDDVHVFADVLSDCFEQKAETVSSEKCEGNSSKHLPFYQFMCTLATVLNVTSEVCENYDATCSFFRVDSHMVNNLTTTTATPTTTTSTPTTTTTTPTTLPERTTTALPLSTTSVQASTTTKPASANACGSSGQTSSDNSTESSAWQIGCLFFAILSLFLSAFCLWLHWQIRRNAQMLRNLREASSNPGMLTAVEPQADRERTESAGLIQTESSANVAPVRNGSLY